MSLWTDITEKVEVGSKVVVDKAKELSQLASLKAQVVSCDNTITKNYKEIGKAYYEAHKDDEAMEYAEFVKNISDSIEKKSGLEAQIAEIKDKAGILDVDDIDEDTVTVESEDTTEEAAVPESTEE